MRIKVVYAGQGTGRNARKRKLARLASSMEASARNGFALACAGIVSKRHAQAHELSNRHRWLGAGLKDGMRHACRTFIPASKLAARPAPFLKYQREDGDKRK